MVNKSFKEGSIAFKTVSSTAQLSSNTIKRRHPPPPTRQVKRPLTSIAQRQSELRALKLKHERSFAMVRVLEKARLVPSLSSLNIAHPQRSMVNILDSKPKVQRKLRKTKSTKSKVRFVKEP